jgi:hypothetical protein
MAPDTGQGAAFEEDHGSDAGTVIQGIAFYVEDQGAMWCLVHWMPIFSFTIHN